MLKHITIFTIILMYFFGGVHLVFSAGTPLERIQRLEEENQDLREKILEKAIYTANEKENAYDKALNNFNLIFTIYGSIVTILLGVFVWWFGFKSWPEFKKNTKADILTDIKGDIPKIESNIKSELSDKNSLVQGKIDDLTREIQDLKTNYEKTEFILKFGEEFKKEMRRVKDGESLDITKE